MFSLATISRPYALAIFEHASETNTLNSWADFLINLSELNQSSANLVTYFESFSSQSDILTESLVESLSLKDQTMISLIKILQQAKRLSCASQICDQFLALKRKKENSQRVRVESAFELNKNQIKDLKTNLEKNLKKTVELQVEVNHELIGGFVIVIDDFVIDYSIQAKLNRLKNELLI